MNQYGERAQRHWQQYRATEYAQLRDPEKFFTDLGERIAAEIDHRKNQQRTPLGSDYLANVGALNNVSSSVEDDVMREMAFTDPGGPM